MNIETIETIDKQKYIYKDSRYWSYETEFKNNYAQVAKT